MKVERSCIELKACTSDTKTILPRRRGHAIDIIKTDENYPTFGEISHHNFICS